MGTSLFNASSFLAAAESDASSASSDDASSVCDAPTFDFSADLLATIIKESGSGTLWSWCLVSHDARAVASPLLWRELEFDDPEQAHRVLSALQNTESIDLTLKAVHLYEASCRLIPETVFLLWQLFEFRRSELAACIMESERSHRDSTRSSLWLLVPPEGGLTSSAGFDEMHSLVACLCPTSLLCGRSPEQHAGTGYTLINNDHLQDYILEVQKCLDVGSSTVRIAQGQTQKALRCLEHTYQDFFESSGMCNVGLKDLGDHLRELIHQSRELNTAAAFQIHQLSSCPHFGSSPGIASMADEAIKVVRAYVVTTGRLLTIERFDDSTDRFVFDTGPHKSGEMQAALAQRMERAIKILETANCTLKPVMARMRSELAKMAAGGRRA